MERKSKQLTERIIELRKAIKRKYRSFKDGTVESEIMLEKQYKPIIEELRKTTPKAEVTSFKQEPKEEFKEEPMDYNTTTDEEGEEGNTPTFVSSTPHRNLTDAVRSPEDLETASRFIDEYFQNPLTKKYMTGFLKDVGGRQRTTDDVYGPRYEGAILKIGDKGLDFDGNGNVLVDGINYGASEGLYELVFKRTPDEDLYTGDDLKTYKSILIASNAHKKGYKFHNVINRNQSLKYRHVIKNLFPVQGKGMMWKTTKSRDIVHWNDPNELVERLQHIVMSTETGNRVHSNEILSIMEELREAGYIRGLGNSRFKSLLK